MPTRVLPMLVAWLLVAVGALICGPSAPASAVPGAATRIMIVGDSISQGSTGDFTWRYFAAKALSASGALVDFVGPSRDLYDGPGQPGSLSYADANFDADHAASWGNSLAYPKTSPGELAATYRPDVTVLFLGVNDLIGLKQDPGAVVARTHEAVVQLRSANPLMRIVVVPPAAAMDANAAALTQSLKTWAGQLPPGRSVTLAEPPIDFASGDKLAPGDTWDGLHPNTRGQVKLAASVTDALAGVGVGGGYPKPLVFPAEGLRQAATLSATSAITGVHLSWVNPPGATTSRIWQRNATTGEAWQLVGEWIPGTTWSGVGLVGGHTHEYRVQSVKVWVPAQDLYSNVVSVVPTSLPTPPMAPTASTTSSTAPAPVSAVPVPPRPRAQTSRRTVRLQWAAVPGATAYQVSYRVGASAWREEAVQTVTHWGLQRTGSERVLVRVRSWTGTVSSRWSRTVTSGRRT